MGKQVQRNWQDFYLQETSKVSRAVLPLMPGFQLETATLATSRAQHR